MEAPGKGPSLEIKSDEDWKDRVKAEDAKLDAELDKAKSASTRPVEESPEPTELPKPQFASIIAMFSTQAMVALGVLANPDNPKPQVELPLAKHFIDILGVLEEKTRGNLSESEQKMLEQSLHELRLAYVEVSRRK